MRCTSKGLILAIILTFILTLVQTGHVLALQIPVVRVLLDEGLDSVKINGDLEIAGLKEPLICNGEKTFKKLDLTGVITVRAQSGYISVNGLPYRGDIILKPKPEGIVVIDLVDLESYVASVVPGEISSDWPMEALKAQAVAARCYAVYQCRTRINQEFDVYDDLRSQMYGGVSKERPRTSDAVQQTAGQVATFNGEVIQAYFFAAGGGQTASSESVWGRAIPYLVSVPDYDQNSPYYQWRVTIPVQDFLDKLKTTGIDIGMMQDISLKRDSSNRVITVNITGSASDCSMIGTKFRVLFELKSTNFQIDLIYPENKPLPVLGKAAPQPDKEQQPPPAEMFSRNPIALQISGYGYGHGVGLSQWGAREMAQKGSTYKEIIAHYYPGSELIKLY